MPKYNVRLKAETVIPVETESPFLAELEALNIATYSGLVFPEWQIMEAAEIEEE